MKQMKQIELMKLKLPEKPYVIREEESDIIDSELKHRNALNPQTKGKTRDLLGS